MKKWIRSKLWIYFSFLVLIISVIVLVVSMLLLTTLEHFQMLGILHNISGLKWLIPLSTLATIGVIISAIVSNYILKPISQLREAMDKVVDSDFSVQLDEKQVVLEVENLYRAFNLMVKELNGIERFQSDFTSIISHEFKTPLATIQGYVQLLQSPDISDEVRHEYCQNILSASRRLSTMTNNILKLTKLDNQVISIENKYYSLDEQIRQSILFLQPQWEDKGIVLTIDLDPVSFCGNEELMEQVWINLFSNAIQYNHPHGQIIVKLVNEANHLIVEIEDTGVGIPKEKLPHIFETFYQVDGSRFSSGNGLGLAIVKRIIDLHQGQISYDSIYGEGTLARIRLPHNKKTLPASE